MKNKNLIHFVYLSVFMAEFSFFFAIPVLGKTDSMVAKDIALCFSLSVILESIMLLSITGYLERYSRRVLLCVSLALRGLAFVTVIIYRTPLTWLCFFTLIAVSKSISKPFTREILSETLVGEKLKKSLISYSFFQNSAIAVAPLVASFTVSNSQEVLVMKTLVIVGFIMSALSMTIVYDYPTGYNPLSKYRSSMYFLYSGMREITRNPAIRSLLITSFLCFSIMGCFITVTTLLPRIREEFSGYIGIFFSVVGVCISLWQGVIARMINLSERAIFIIVVTTGLCSSLYITGGICIAVLSLIAYSIYESVIIPYIYYKSSVCQSSLSASMVFSYILAASNTGEAFGSWITGVAIDHASDIVPELLIAFISLSAVISVWTLSFVKISTGKENG